MVVKLTKILAYGDIDDDALLALAASLERASEHPLGEAIVAGARIRASIS